MGRQLTAQEQAILDMDIPADLAKEASEMVKEAQDLYSFGFDKLASEASEAMDHEKEEKEKEDKEPKKELSDEHKKEASDKAAFMARGFVDGLIEKGASVHGNELHYFEDAIVEKIAELKGKDVANKAMGYMKSIAHHGKQAVTGVGARHGEKLDSAARLASAGKAAVKAAPVAAAAGVAGYGASKAMSKDDK